jgi:hypothetical protein
LYSAYPRFGAPEVYGFGYMSQTIALLAYGFAYRKANHGLLAYKESGKNQFPLVFGIRGHYLPR